MDLLQKVRRTPLLTSLGNTQSCSTSVKFPIAAVIIAALAVGVIAIVAIIVFIHNRKLKTRYNLLQQEYSSKTTVELDSKNPVELETVNEQ